MTNHKPGWFDGRASGGSRTRQSSRVLAGLLLLLSIFLLFAWGEVNAQPGPVQEKKEIDLPKAAPATPPETVAAPVPPDTAPPPSQPAGGFRSKVRRVLGQPVPSVASPPPAPQPLSFHIDPKSPLKDLLPTPPKSSHPAGPMLRNDLNQVPEIQFEAANTAQHDVALKRLAHQMAKINHLNEKKLDGFMEALTSERPDLAGLPFAMGDACRTKGERSKQFALAVAAVRQALQSSAPSSTPQPTAAPTPPMSGAAPATMNPAFSPVGGFASGSVQSLTNTNNDFIVFSAFSPAAASTAVASPETFWEQYQNLCSQQDKPQARPEHREMVTLARLAALSQILMPMPEMHPGLVKYLAALSHVEATRALARLALFSRDEDVRQAALEALKVRRERDYTDILTQGLRYPWPAVARRAAEAITKLERNDLVPQLIDVLEQADPRAPVMESVKGKRVPVVREMVRVNHHRNCLLCHAPGNTGKVSSDAVTAEVPVPGQPLNPPTGPYNASRQEILVRVDVTYLRQDFSALLPVADANPWPEMQRFDFLVRKRTLSEDEAESYREKLKSHESGVFSPYQRAALAALRDLTGRDTEPTPEAWRRLLKLPAESQGKSAIP